MPLSKDKYSIDDLVVFCKVTKGILSFEFADKMNYDEAVVYYAGNKESANMYNGASFVFHESRTRREAHSIVNDFIFLDYFGFDGHCQACGLSLVKKIQSSNIQDILSFEIAMTEFVIEILKRNNRDRYGTVSK